jgi:hypothetical protein
MQVLTPPLEGLLLPCWSCATFGVLPTAVFHTDVFVHSLLVAAALHHSHCQRTRAIPKPRFLPGLGSTLMPGIECCF